MKCPSCGNPDAYLGFTNIDCPNTACKHHNSNTPVHAPKSTATAPVPVAPMPGGIGSSGTQPSPPGSAPNNNLTTQLGVTIMSKQPKVNSVLLSFKAWGDPGFADKRVEFFFSLPNGVQKQVCTLSNSLRYYVDGVDADNQTIYTTHWMCTQDGVRPTDQFMLDANIYP